MQLERRAEVGSNSVGSTGSGDYMVVVVVVCVGSTACSVDW